MGTILNLEGKNVAVGLQWSPIRTESSEKAEAAAIAKEQGAEFGIVFNSHSTTLVGIFEGVAPKGLICGAAWLAETVGKESDVILVEPVTDDTSWFCAIRNGGPLQGYDAVVNNADVLNLIASLTNVAGGDGQVVEDYTGYTVYSRDGFVENSLAGDLLSLTSAELEEDEVPLDPPVVVRIRGVARSVLWIGGSLFLFAAIYGGVSYFLAAKHDREEAEAAAYRREHMAAAAKVAQEQISAFERNNLEVVLKQKILEQPSYSTAVIGWMNALQPMPTVIAGWKLSLVDCNALRCELTFQHEKLGTIDDFAFECQQKGYTIRSAVGNLAVVTVLLTLEKRTVSVDSIPASTEFMWHFTSQFQRMEMAGLEYQIKAAEKEKTKTEAKPGHPAVETESPWGIGTFEVRGKRLFEIRDTKYYLGTADSYCDECLAFQNFTANKLAIDFARNTWKIEGSYASK